MRNATLILFFLTLAAMVRLNAEDLATGEAVFNSNCAICHGSEGTGGRGPNLHGPLRNGDQDSDIEKVIRNGLPGTGMPKFDLEKDELHALVEYIQSLRHASPSGPHPQGDKVAGKRLYDSSGCSRCHEIDNQGGTLGPSLTRVGASRSYEYLKTSIVDPSADIPDDYQTVKIVTRDGKHYQGVWVNEDSFTIQIRLPDESFASFDKQGLQEEVHEKKSLMPAYHFSDTDLKNLLSYLSSLTGDTQTASDARREEKAR